MGLAAQPSIVSLPDEDHPTVMAFLARRFPAIAAHEWAARIRAGRVLTEDGRPIGLATPYCPRARILYYREVEREPLIPFAEEILFMDGELLAACKPHFLPVTPSGPYVAECLMNRLRRRTGNPDLQPLHRIDRATGGLVLFSCNRATRGRYQELFRLGQVEKTYEALSVCAAVPDRTEWEVRNRIVKGEPFFRMRIVAGEPNAHSRIRLVAAGRGHARFLLNPLTGKTHQLRLHMSALGFPILNDRYYPELLEECPDDFTRPLQLIARSARFFDPVRGRNVEFSSPRALLSAD